VGHKVFLDFKGASDVPAHAVSEGTLITLALLTALCSPKRPRILLLDDIDHSLHPQAQMHLMRELKRLLAEFPDVQLVATTHSPYILDELEPSDVRVFALRPDGSVACRSLSEHPEAEKTRGVLTSGQLWSLDPEWRWVVGEG
jgi:predicted ATPase